jgi:hypothetical protein
MQNEWKSRMENIVDSHVHMHGYAEEENLMEIFYTAGIKQTILQSIQKTVKGTGKPYGLPQALYMKSKFPKKFYAFAGLNHTSVLSNGRVNTHDLATQVGIFAAMGCDGIKMIECKPTERQEMNIPLTDAYYADYWAKVEDMGLPLTCHVNDPEEFWEPEKLPTWAREKKWGYGAEDVQKEQLYTEVDEILKRHPNLKFIFAHFYFLSADLPRMKRFLDAHPSVKIDLAPGIEMLYNCSKTLEESRDFFLNYADRIIFGTDIHSDLSIEEGVIRAGIVFRWLESEDTFRVPLSADFLLGQPEDGIIHGLKLPDTVLAKIYRGNIHALIGETPNQLLVDNAIEYCNHLGEIGEAMSGIPAGELEAMKVAAKLAAMK